MRYSVFSDKGKVRTTNEDNYYIEDNEENKYILLSVADGMGGHQAGEIASELTVKYLQNHDFDLKLDINRQIDEVINNINQHIIKQAEKDDKFQGMGTTLSLGLISKRKLYYGHVGDSRIYVLRKKKLIQLTTDDTLVQEMVDQNKIDPKEAFGHPRSNILTQSLGIDQKLDIETNSISLNRNDLVIFCTDGLTDLLNNEKIKEIALKHEIEQLASHLGQQALKKGGRDNITVLVLNIN